jgi:hypothetical protein
MPQGNPFKTSYRYSMGSNAVTDINQGGGNKKAGFPYMIGRDSWSSIAINTCNPKVDPIRCCSLKSLQFTVNPNVRQNLPIGMSGHGTIKMH